MCIRDSQSTIAADATSDTFNVAAGTGIQITTDASTDTMTITNTVTAAAAADAVFKTLAVSGQANVTAASATDTLNLAAGDGMDITTNDGSSANTFRNEALERLSKEGFLVHNLKNTLDFKPVEDLSDELIQSRLATKAVAFDHLTYKLLTQNRWLSPVS